MRTSAYGAQIFIATIWIALCFAVLYLIERNTRDLPTIIELQKQLADAQYQVDRNRLMTNANWNDLRERERLERGELPAVSGTWADVVELGGKP